MRWITRSHLHLDRVATPWLIARFIDPQAEFEFVDWDTQPREADSETWFGLPGAEFSAHDGNGTCFHKMLTRHDLDDPALAIMDRVVSSGVAEALGAPPPAGQTEFEAALGGALNRIGLGLVIAVDDRRHLEVGMSLYESVYVLCQLQLAEIMDTDLPATMPDRVRVLREAINRTSPEG